MTTSSTGAHILVFPYPAQGHMLPLLDLTHQLALRNLAITILITPKNVPILNPLLSTHPTSIQTFVLPFPPQPCLPPGAENSKDIPVCGVRAMMRALGDLYDPILHWFHSHPSPPTAIISDMFLGWTEKLASQIGIKRYVFSPSGAYGVSIMNSLWRDLSKRNCANDENTLVSFPDIPSSPKYPFCQLSTLFRLYKEGDPDMEFIKDGMRANMVSWGIIFNTFTEFESVYLEHVKKDLGHERVFAVGPLRPSYDAPDKRGGSSSADVNCLLSWLDTCTKASVVYVCFGSQAVLTNRQMEELASGLDKSGVRFVWSVKKATSGHADGEYGLVPPGFKERTAGRGFLIEGWAPQIVILNHPAVGSFLTHCGWNSVLEAIVAGVPMLTWPMGADQYTNANLLVDGVGVAVRVCEGVSTVPNANELAQKITESVAENRLLGSQARELSQAAMKAVTEGGSSFFDLDNLVKELDGSEVVTK